VNIEDFRYISTIAKLGSFSMAAQALFISQPALSQRVKHIEKEYGITLFTRSSKGVETTEDGTIFVNFANEILYSESCLRQFLLSRQHQSIERIRIGTSQLINSYIFDLLLDTFRKTFPNIKLDIVIEKSGPLQKLLLSGDLDIAIIHDINTPYDQLVYRTLCEDQIVLVPAKGSSLDKKIQDLGKQIYAPISFDILQNEPFALIPQELFLWRKIAAALRENHVDLDVQQYSENYDFLYKMAKKGNSSTFLLESYFNPDEDYIPYYYLDTDNFSLLIQIAYRKDSPAALICEEFADLTLDLNLQAKFF